MTKEEFLNGINEFLTDENRAGIVSIVMEATTILPELKEHDELLANLLSKTVENLKEVNKHIEENYGELESNKLQYS